MVTSVAPTTLFIDLGGVVVDVDEQRAEHTLRESHGVPYGTYAQLVVASGRKQALDLGHVGADAAFAAAAAESGVVTADALSCAHEAILTVRPPVVSWLNSLADQGARLVVLSNTDPVHAAWIQRNAGLRAHRWLFSYEFGLLKPDPALFSAACARIEVSPWDAALLDDRADNLSAAAGLGILGVHYTSLDAATLGLGALGWEPV